MRDENNDMVMTPVKITKEKLEKLKDHLNYRFGIFKDGTETYDLDQLAINVGYSIGSYYTTYNGLLFKERLRLAEIEDDVSLAKAIAYDEIKMGRKTGSVKYEVDSKGLTLLINGHELVRKAVKNYNKQEHYVSYLEGEVKRIGYYGNGVKTILEREKLKAMQGV